MEALEYIWNKLEQPPGPFKKGQAAIAVGSVQALRYSALHVHPACAIFLQHDLIQLLLSLKDFERRYKRCSLYHLPNPRRGTLLHFFLHGLKNSTKDLILAFCLYLAVDTVAIDRKHGERKGCDIQPWFSDR